MQFNHIINDGVRVVSQSVSQFATRAAIHAKVSHRKAQKNKERYDNKNCLLIDQGLFGITLS